MAVHGSVHEGYSIYRLQYIEGRRSNVGSACDILVYIYEEAKVYIFKEC
jgi:hypothetical protein